MADLAPILPSGHRDVLAGQRRADLRVVTQEGMPHRAKLTRQQIPAPAQAADPPSG